MTRARQRDQHRLAWVASAVIFVVAAVLCRAINSIGLVPDLPSSLPQIYSGPDWFSESLVRNSLLRFPERGDSDLGGFMITNGEYHIKTVQVIDGPNVIRESYPYISNFNLQYDILKVFTLGQTGLGSFAFYFGKFLSLIGMAAVVATIARFAAREFSEYHGAAVLAVFCLSPMMLERSMSAYWFIFLKFLPFVATLVLYPSMRDGRSFLSLGALVSVLVMVTSLTGYEYITNVALGAALPIVYYELRDAQNHSFATWRRILIKSIWIGVASVVGFAAATALHVLKAGLLFGGLAKGLNALLVPFAYSTIGSETGIKGGLSVGWPLFRAAFETLIVRNAHINLAVVLTLAVALTCILADRTKSWRAYVTAPTIALSWTLLLAFITTVSWAAGAWRHVFYHMHINWIAMYMFFLPFGAIASVEAVRIALHRSWKPREQTP